MGDLAPEAPMDERRDHKREGRLKHLRVQVEPKGSETSEKDRVNIRVPLKLLGAGVKLSSVLPEHAKDRTNHALREKGMDFDLSLLEGETFEGVLESLAERGMEVDTDDKQIRISFE
jgi:hypothetical protein